MPKVPPETKARQLAETEEAMVKLRSEFRILDHIGRKWSVAPRTVQRWMKEVRDRWRAEASARPSDEIRDQRRDDMRKTLGTIVTEAMTRVVQAKDGDGKWLVDEKGKPVMRLLPDLQRALHALAQLRHLDGLDAPQRAEISVTGVGDQLPDLAALPQAARDALEAGITALAPNGDLRQLAAELFAVRAREAKAN
jgi:hypothetical protein